MKRYILSIVLCLSLSSFLVSDDLDGYWEVSPVLSIRHDNLDDGVSVSDAIGLRMSLGGSKFTGFDTDGTDYRIFMGWGLGKLGIGHDGSGDPEYTFGTTYEVLDNVSMDLDYVFGEEDNNLRLAIQIHF